MPAFNGSALGLALVDFLWSNPLLVALSACLLVAVVASVAVNRLAEHEQDRREARMLAAVAREQARRKAQDDIVARISRNHRQDVA